MFGKGWGLVSGSCLICTELLPSGRSSYCQDCKTSRTLYSTTKSNLASGFNRTSAPPSLDITADDFCLWRKKTEQVCHFCKISQADIARVGMKSQVQNDVKNMGVDRLDSDRGYELSNIAPCCFVCNQVKGNRFTEDEMALIAPGIAQVWATRLAKAS